MKIVRQKVRQKLEENRRVYEGGRLEKNAVKMQSEAEPTTAERSRDGFQEGERAEVREQSRSAEELREPEETILVREEQELFEPSEAASTGADSIREISDELERLAQRYGRGMEEWLYDQSAI